VAPPANGGGAAIAAESAAAFVAATPAPFGVPLADPSDDTDMVQARVPDLSGQGLRLFGWGMLILLLLAGGGAVLLALDSERGEIDAGRSDRYSEAPAAAGAPGAGAPAAARPRQGAAAGEERPGAGRSAAARDREADRAEGDRRGERPVAAAPRHAQEARALLDEATGLVSRLDWDGARQKYELVAAGKFHRNQAYLGLAKVAFETKRAEDAIAYARRAGNGAAARVLLGHAFYQKGDFAEALTYYESVLRQDPDHTEAQNGAKAARDNLGAGAARAP
jgi:tetratricopeptide (TPR) repeat protein